MRAGRVRALPRAPPTRGMSLSGPDRGSSGAKTPSIKLYCCVPDDQVAASQFSPLIATGPLSLLSALLSFFADRAEFLGCQQILVPPQCFLGSNQVVERDHLALAAKQLDLDRSGAYAVEITDA